MKGSIKFLILSLVFFATAQASDVRFEQRIGAKLPRDTVFRDEEGKLVYLGSLLDGKPLVLNLSHFGGHPQSLWVLRNLARSIANVQLKLGRQYRIVTISIDPSVTASRLLEGRREFLRWIPGAEDSDAGCRFLSGDRGAIDRVAQAVGMHYLQDSESGEYTQPAGIVIVGPDGSVSRYFFGASFPPTELREALGEFNKGFFSSLYDAVKALGGLGG